MQHTLIRSVDAENAILNKKVDQMEDLVNQNDELTDEEKNKQQYKLSRNIKMK